MPNEWIVIPNWSEYQHYKKRDPVWLRDYVRQLWHPQWLPLSLPQRGLLQTARLAYAHHNGQLSTGDLQSYVPKYERSHVPTIAKRLNEAGLLGLVASTPLSLKALNQLDAHAGENKRNGPPACPFCEIGGGHHLSDCPTLEHPEMLVERLMGRHL